MIKLIAFVYHKCDHLYAISGQGDEAVLFKCC